MITGELLWVLTVVLGTLLLFATEKIRLDTTALLALLALAVPGLLTPQEALAGFADQSVIIIAALFVVGGAIFRTGLADTLGAYLQKTAGTSWLRIVLLLMGATAALSAFLSSTGTVAVMLPVATGIARRARLSPSLLLMPVAFAALLGGSLTLIATPPNLIVSGELEAAGLAPFGFFSLTGPGLLLLAAGMAYMALAGRRLLRERVPATSDGEQPRTAELWERYGLADSLAELRVEHASPVAGRSISSAGFRSRYGVSILAVTSRAAGGAVTREARPETPLQPGDVLTVKGTEETVGELASCERLTELRLHVPLPENMVMAEALVTPASELTGRTVADAQFRDRHGVDITGIRRGDRILEGRVSQARLQTGDALLLLGTPDRLRDLGGPDGGLVLVTETRELHEAAFRRDRAPWALAIMIGMMAVMATGLLPNAVAALAAAVACVLSGCLSMEEAYREINWPSVILIACMLPLATALQKTGGLDLLIGGLTGLLAGLPGPVVLALLFLLTAVVGLVISNTATAVLLAPVAVQLAGPLGLNPYALALVVALACSAAFATPVSSPVNTLVLAGGGYRFSDFVRTGLPLLAVHLVVTVSVVPLFFPLAVPGSDGPLEAENLELLPHPFLSD